jgi:hypothetical protein
VFLGSDPIPFTLSLGILMDGLWVASSSCTKCKRTFHSYNRSEHPESEDLGQQKSYYNEIFHLDITGNIVKETVTVNELSSVSFPIVVADRFVDVLNLAMDGIIGLGFNRSSIVYQLFESQVIDKPIYSLSYLSDPFLVLGTPNFLELSLVVSTQQNISFRSPMQIAYFSFAEFVDSGVESLEFNSISSYITGPFDVLEGVFKVLVDKGCHYEEELLMCDCKQKGLPNFVFHIQGQAFTISSANYLIKVKAT